MAFNVNDLLSRKLTLIVIAALIGVAVIVFQLYREGVLLTNREEITDIYQNNNELIITDTISPSDTTTIIQTDSL